MIEIKLNLTASPELLEALNNIAAAFRGQNVASAQPAAVQAEAPAPKPAPKKTPAPKVVEVAPVAEEAPAVDVTAADPTAEGPKKYTDADVRALVVKVSQEGKKPEIRDYFNNELGVKGVGEIDPSLYPQVIEKLKSL